MINTKCPECSARFYVSEELVVGKVVRFRCRKCGGTITVDGTKGGFDEVPETMGPDSGLHSRLPPEPDKAAVGLKVEIKEPGKGTLRPPAAMPPPQEERNEPRPPAPPKDLDDDWATSSAVRDKEPHESKPDPKETEAENRPPKLPKPPGLDDKVKATRTPTPRPAAAKPIQLPKPKEEPKTVPLPKETPAAKTSPKPADADGEPTAILDDKQKSKLVSKSMGKEAKPPPSSSKPRLSRVSMDLGSVFDMPADEQEVDVPMEVDDAPVFEEEIDAETVSLVPESVEPDAPTRPKPPAPKIKPPPPPVLHAKKVEDKPRISSDHVDIMAAVRTPVDPRAYDDSADLFAPVAFPSDPLGALEVPAESDDSQDDAKLAPALAPALAPVEPTMPAERAGGSKLGMYIGIGAAAVVVLLGIGFLAMRGPSNEVSPTPAVTTAQPDETATSVSTAPVTGTPTTAEAPKDVPPSDTAQNAEPKGTAAAVTAVATTTATSEPTSTSQPTTTSTATATAPATEPTKTTPEPTSTKPPEPPKPPPGGGGEFNKSAAKASIGALKGAAQGCKQPGGPQGHAKVAITFAPTGRVTVATVVGPPFAGTPVGGCIASVFRGASVPPFSGANVTVQTSVPIF